LKYWVTTRKVIFARLLNRVTIMSRLEGIYKTVQSHEGRDEGVIDETPVQGTEGREALMRHLSRVPRGGRH
jgi:hypothetical protein